MVYFRSQLSNCAISLLDLNVPFGGTVFSKKHTKRHTHPGPGGPRPEIAQEKFQRLSALDADAMGNQARLLAEYGAIHHMGSWACGAGGGPPKIGSLVEKC